MHLYHRFDQLRNAKEKKSGIRTKSLFVVCIFFCFLLALFVLNKDLSSLIASHTDSVKPEHDAVTECPALPASSELPGSQADKTLQTIRGCVSSGQSFYAILSNHGFAPSLLGSLVETFKPVFDCRKILPGNSYQIVTDSEGNLVSLVFKTSPIDVFRLTRDGETLVPSKDTIILDKRPVVVVGEVVNSLFGALSDAGEKDQLAIIFAEIFAWDIDFRHDLRRGDRFRAIVEKYYQDDAFIRYGNIRAAEYINRGKVHRATYFKDPDGREDYFSPEGTSLRRSFLRSPLRFNRISSGYSHRRFHPILKRRMPHLGIDFAAPTGTPVRAVGDGVVTRRGWKNGNGNMVNIRHPNGYETMYNHLSRFGKNIAVGGRVKQKDIIGYVGSTGLSTGPHLDYRMKKNGRFINPLKEKFPLGLPVNKTHQSAFLKVSRQMTTLLDGEGSPPQKIVAAIQ
jgi:murein DD-endopeptidase MepM/ murein hydrolase activator NlpD